MQFLPRTVRTLRWTGMLLIVCAIFAICGKANPHDLGGNSGIAVKLKDIAGSGYLADLRWPNFSDYKTQLVNFYGLTNYSPVWVQGAQPTSQAFSMIEQFKNAWKRGLEPEDYDASRWVGRLQALQGSDSALARFDVALTLCTMRFVSDLRIGRINPQHFKFGLSVQQKKYDLDYFLRDRLLPATDISAALDGVEPPFAGYRHTQTALVRYIELARQDDNQKLPPSAKAINHGDSYAGVPV